MYTILFMLLLILFINLRLDFILYYNISTYKSWKLWDGLSFAIVYAKNNEFEKLVLNNYYSMSSKVTENVKTYFYKMIYFNPGLTLIVHERVQISSELAYRRHSVVKLTEKFHTGCV